MQVSQKIKYLPASYSKGLDSMDALLNDRRQIYDLDYFIDGGAERRKGSWDRRSGRDRRLTLSAKYMFLPERRTGQDRRSRWTRSKYRGKSHIDRLRKRIEHRLHFQLVGLEQTLAKRGGMKEKY